MYLLFFLTFLCIPTFLHTMSPPVYIQNNQNNDLLPINSLGLPMLTLPCELFNPLYGTCTENFITFPTVVPPLSPADDQLEYVPYFSLTSHPLNCNPLFYFDVQTQQFLPLDQSYHIRQVSSTIAHTPLKSTLSMLTCGSCHQPGHMSAISKKCHNYR